MNSLPPGRSDSARVGIRLGFLLGISVIPFTASLADDNSALTLPQGVSLFDTTFYYYFPITERYNADGEVEPLGAALSADLNSQVFPALKALDPFVGGAATIGNSVVESELTYRWWEFNYAYGINDQFSVGIKIPYNYSKNTVNARLDASSANVGKNPLYGTPQDPVGSPLIPTAIGGIPLTTEDVQDLLGQGLDVNGDGQVDIPGYGYNRFQTVSESGIGDIELLGKYKFYEERPWRLAGTFGVRLPTGKLGDPDELGSIDFGTDQTDLLFRFHADYLVTKNLLFDLTLRYDWQLPGKRTLRIPESSGQPITPYKETVDLDPGDGFEVDLLADYQFTPEWSASLRYSYTQKFEDSIDGDQGFPYYVLEDASAEKSQRIFLTVGYSTIQKYLDKQAPIPFAAGLTYRNRFAGENTTKSQYLSLSLVFLF